eukprot:2766211-Pleurochrysis_carterae.AAC.4
MNGNENKCLSNTFVSHKLMRALKLQLCSRPKPETDEIKEAIKFHIVGLIFHGKPDVAHLSPALPHLADNSNLNCECFMQAFRQQYGQSDMLPLLRVQLDNAPAIKQVGAWFFRLVDQTGLCQSSSLVDDDGWPHA